jgi:hypothetical protein
MPKKEGAGSQYALVDCPQQMPSYSEKILDGSVCGKETLHLSC